MANTTTPDGPSSGADLAGRLSLMSDRTNLMVVEATLRALPAAGTGYAQAAEEVLGLSRRIARTAADFKAALELAPAG